MQPQLILDPVLQSGFFGLSAVLLVILVWLIRRLLKILEETNSVIASCTRVIESVDRRSGEMLKINRALHDRLLSRPCIALRE